MVIFRGDGSHRIRLITVTRKILLGDPCENPCEAVGHIAFLLEVSPFQQHSIKGRTVHIAHLLDTNHQYNPPASGADKIHALINRSRPGSARILNSRRGLVSQRVESVHYQRRAKILFCHARVKPTEKNRIDVFRP